jgi:hypothetical protein
MRLRSSGLCMTSHKSVRRCTFSQKSAAVAEHAGEDERRRRRHVRLPAIAQLVDVLALDAHRFSERRLA